jgi:hypothetical protein
VITQRIPSSDGQGQTILKLVPAEGRPALLKFDGAVLASNLETIHLTDAGLRESWGPQIYRIVLKSQPVAIGKWTYTFSAA